LVAWLTGIEVAKRLVAGHAVNDGLIESGPGSQLERFEAGSKMIPVRPSCIEFRHGFGKQRTAQLLNLVD
jgi:hypothetical protein